MKLGQTCYIVRDADGQSGPSGMATTWQQQ
jgi:hypothetical protein